MADLLDEVNYRPNEERIEWTVAQFKGKNKLIDMSLKKEGVLIITNQRIIFRGGVVLGHGFKKEISMPINDINNIFSERKLTKDEARKLLIIVWSNKGESNSAVFLPLDSKSTTGGMAKSITKTVDPTRKGLAEEWVDKTQSAVQKYSDSTEKSLQTSQATEETPPPPPPAENQNECSDCGKELRYIDEYDRWYCDNCEEYK